MPNNLPAKPEQETLKELVELLKEWRGIFANDKSYVSAMLNCADEVEALLPALSRKIAEAVKAEHARVCFKPITGDCDRCKELEGIYGQITTASH